MPRLRQLPSGPLQGVDIAFAEAGSPRAPFELRSSLLVVLAGALALSCSWPEPGTSVSLEVELYPQEASMWCWAASGQVVAAHFGRAVSQCSQASAKFSRVCPCDLCAADSTREGEGECDKPGWPDFEGFSYSRTHWEALDWETLIDNVCPNPPSCSAGRPVAFAWKYPGGSGHMMVATGFSVSKLGKHYVEVFDPASDFVPCVGTVMLIDYETYVEGEEGDAHWHDFYDFEEL